MKRIQLYRQRGAVLIVMIAALAVIAALVRQMVLWQASQTTQVAAELDHQAAQYLAEAGLRHALWRARTSGNASYPSLVSGNLEGQGSYQASITPTTGTPITVTSTGTTSGGSVFKMSRSYAVACVGKTPMSATITSYAVNGEPAMLFEHTTNANQGYLDPRDNSGYKARAVMNFDLSRLPRNVTFESAELRINVLQHDPGAEGARIMVSRVTSTWESAKVSWTHAIRPNRSWINPGGDSTGSYRATLYISPNTEVYAWDITPMVQGWINGTFPSQGVILESKHISSMNSGEFRLMSATGSTPLEQRPRLFVTWCS